METLDMWLKVTGPRPTEVQSSCLRHVVSTELSLTLVSHNPSSAHTHRQPDFSSPERESPTLLPPSCPCLRGSGCVLSGMRRAGLWSPPRARAAETSGLGAMFSHAGRPRERPWLWVSGRRKALILFTARVPCGQCTVEPWECLLKRNRCLRSCLPGVSASQPHFLRLPSSP